MEDQPTLFPVPCASYTTADGRTVDVPKRGKHYVQQRGYAGKPGTGPAGETCKTCEHYTIVRMAKSYRKCGLNRAKWTGGARSDILAGSPACEKWTAPGEAKPDTGRDYGMSGRMRRTP